jgi:hypothetical protein
MMGVLEAILPAVARSSALSLDLYRVAASSHNEAAKDLIKAAGAINNFASISKQIATIIKEDDQLPSQEVCQHSTNKSTPVITSSPPASCVVETRWNMTLYLTIDLRWDAASHVFRRKRDMET